MESALRSMLDPVVPICGQARTVAQMAGDCGILSVAAAEANPGEILVVDAVGATNVAVWGGMMTEAAVVRKLGGLVLDGAVRDVGDIRRLQFPTWARAHTPRGPHHGFGGDIDVPVSVGGVPVHPGDIVLGDEDGVVVVPLERSDDILARAQAHLEKEADWLRRIHAGESIPDIFDMPAAEQAS